jgi:hypothetical protein
MGDMVIAQGPASVKSGIAAVTLTGIGQVWHGVTPFEGMVTDAARPDVGHGFTGRAGADPARASRAMPRTRKSRQSTRRTGTQHFLQQILGSTADHCLARWIAVGAKIAFDKHQACVGQGHGFVKSVKQILSRSQTFDHAWVFTLVRPYAQLVFWKT